MKKLVLVLGLLGSVISFGAKLKVGASPVPHAQLLQLVKDDLKKENVELEIIELTDYVTPNLLLDSKELDANFFQHKPYLETFSKEKNLKLVSAGNVHVEPLGVYSKKVNKIENLKKGGVVAIPNDPTNGGRALILLHNNGIIKLKNPQDLLATEFDIVENKNNLKFKSLDAAQIPRALEDVDLAVVNGNYAIEAGLNPLTEALIIEGKESPYANLIAVREGDEKKEDIQKLVKVLQSEKVKVFIENTYKGGVVPAF
ncbi:MetQ/NlpA family ABC transporter substrate-binding protein [Cetobacterium somerae]|uniref:MetQ/NlpA family ABC transporter substrate-binding protein n=1 Tax=Cetobacterium somerae TaxID=188913 RepID=UPI001F06BE35|nr:MetQ/NlpA family ABC transporter substrate-binding protein [Cetobacterium somerae]UPO97257.1 MetQ/NlpA family ABC transporter substrate-binding protein [Cetobacterium somerae]